MKRIKKKKLISWVSYNNRHDCSAVYDSAPVRGAAPGHVNPLGRPGVNFGGTTVMGEPHHEPSVIVVSPTTGINQRGSTDPTRTFVEGAKAVHPKVNLERPMHLEEDPHAPRRTSQAYAPPNYQTKVTDPTGAGKLNKAA